MKSSTPEFPVKENKDTMKPITNMKNTYHKDK